MICVLSMVPMFGVDRGLPFICHEDGIVHCSEHEDQITCTDGRVNQTVTMR